MYIGGAHQFQTVLFVHRPTLEVYVLLYKLYSSEVDVCPYRCFVGWTGRAAGYHSEVTTEITLSIIPLDDTRNIQLSLDTTSNFK